MINTDKVLHGFTDLKNLNVLGPIVLNQAKGIYVYDQDGKKYLDANSGSVSYTHLTLPTSV